MGAIKILTKNSSNKRYTQFTVYISASFELKYGYFEYSYWKIRRNNYLSLKKKVKKMREKNNKKKLRDPKWTQVEYSIIYRQTFNSFFPSKRSQTRRKFKNEKPAKIRRKKNYIQVDNINAFCFLGFIFFVYLFYCFSQNVIPTI